jgi:hypothetical protein
MNVQVKLVFYDGTYTYTFPLVQKISDPKEGMKSTVLEGNRGDGSIIIPGGKKSIEIEVEGILFDNDGYIDITTLMNTMRTQVTTLPATLTLSHFTTTWVTDWSYSVRRIDPIEFPDSEDLRTVTQRYSAKFLVFSF